MANYYVHPTTGNNSNPGTESQPWQTIAYAKTQLVAGDYLYLRGGSTPATRVLYSEGNTISAAAGCANGSAGNYITITVYPGEYIQITPPNGSRAFYINGRSYWRILGNTTDDPDDIDTEMHFEIDLNQNTNNGYAVEIYGLTSTAGNCVVSYIWAHNAACNPSILTIRGASNNTISYCRVHDHFPEIDVDRSGISIFCTDTVASNDNIIEYNTIYDCAGDGYGGENTVGSVRNTTGTIVRYNHIFLRSSWYSANGKAPAENAIDTKAEESSEYYGNILHGFRDTDITECCSSGDNSLVNFHIVDRNISFHDNILYDFVGYAIYANAGGLVEIYRNLIYDQVEDTDVTNPAIFYCARTPANGNTNHLIYHNTVYGRANNSTARLIRLNDDVICTFRNNIVHTGGNISLGTGATLTASYNCWYNCLQTASGTGDVTSDPLFNNLAGRDFRLTASSPCINAGTNLGDPYSTGYYSTAPDMGYYEYGPASQLLFGGFPTTGTEGVAVTSFTVSAARYDGTTDTAYANSITIAKASGPGNVTGTLTRAPSSGVATFNDIVFDDPGDYTLSATAG